jgi:hypothetical protein
VIALTIASHHVQKEEEDVHVSDHAADHAARRATQSRTFGVDQCRTAGVVVSYTTAIDVIVVVSSSGSSEQAGVSARTATARAQGASSTGCCARTSTCGHAGTRCAVGLDSTEQCGQAQEGETLN